MITLLAIGLASYLIYRAMILAEDVLINKIPLSKDSFGVKYLILAGVAFAAFFILFRSKIRFK
jgi:hypothetical protein